MSIRDYIGTITTLVVDIPNADLKAEIQAALLDAQVAATFVHVYVTGVYQGHVRMGVEIVGEHQQRVLVQKIVRIKPHDVTAAGQPERLVGDGLKALGLGVGDHADALGLSGLEGGRHHGSLVG